MKASFKALRLAALAGCCLAASTAVRAADIVDTAVSAGSFKTLVAAVQAAGLVDALKGKGPLTVFAPTDEAFAKLPAGTLEKLLKPESKKTLTAILTYHVVKGDYSAARITKPKSKVYGLKPLQGELITVDTSKGVKVSGATVRKADIKADNGVIHVIDQVMLPPSVKAALAGKRPAKAHH